MASTVLGHRRRSDSDYMGVLTVVDCPGGGTGNGLTSGRSCPNGYDQLASDMAALKHAMGLGSLLQREHLLHCHR